MRLHLLHFVSVWLYFSGISNEHGNINSLLKEKQMPDKIEIQVMVNDQPATLADVSLKTLTGMRDETVPKLPEPIRHGDYGHIGRDCPENHRLFIEIRGRIHVYCNDGTDVRSFDVNSHHYRKNYTITGNIFKDMRGKENVGS